ncbi:MAG: hypothetical protein KGJ62_10845 [Armatimonadetes bacterium]|nr:hypothetical protein [Armatimonadota bacterium]MDE2206742.1 hypothetical protein [Armatimonadota bacterium]
MRLAPAPFVAALAAMIQTPSVTIKAANTQTTGWMAGGWGGYQFVITNGTAAPVQLVKWSAHWVAGGKRVGDPWGGNIGQSLAARATVTRSEIGELPSTVAAAARPGSAEIHGAFTVLAEGSRLRIPYTITVPAAVLPEPLKTVRGKTVELALMRSRYLQFHQLNRTLRWMDEAYQAMIQLTGQVPFQGRRMVFQESPPHPWWAYAGEHMILNTDYVASTLKDFDDGLISFGWVHEMGHNFDTLGDWYIWSGAAAEFQANFKLCYAFEHIKDQSFRIKWTFQAPGYPSPDQNMRLTGPQLVERFFLLVGDRYLADPHRTWDTLSSDEMHTFFQRLQVAYGWRIFRGWYRTYGKLQDAGLKPPQTPEGKINLIAAILAREARVDLVPVFRQWRFPVTAKSIKAMATRYRLSDFVVPE